MKIAIASYAIGKEYLDVVSPALENQKKYCQKQRYDYLFAGEEIYDPSRPPAWSKILWMQKVLKNYDYVFWMDADALIAEQSIRIEDFFKDYIGTEKFIVLTRDACKNINTGVFLLKNCEWSHKLLKLIWEQEQFIKHGWWENAAFMHLYDINADVKKHTEVIENRKLPFNSYPHCGAYIKGDFIVHFAGIDNNLRKRYIKEFAEKKLITKNYNKQNLS